MPPSAILPGPFSDTSHVIVNHVQFHVIVSRDPPFLGGSTMKPR